MKAPRFLRTKRNRLIFFGSILVICVSIAIYFALQEETYAEQFLNQFFQPKVSKFLLIAIPSFVGVIVLSVSNEIFSGDFHDWLKGKNEEENDNGKLADNIEPDLKILYDSLKERYKKRYKSKLDGRFEITLEVNEDWRFDKPATYKFSAEAKVSEAATAVRNAFDEKGRLLIVGNAGSGKTVLLLNLARQLLGDELKKDQQIPVIFNLASWREDYENFEEWLIEVLNTGNGLSKDFAKTVLREKRIIFLLDGLDELARNEENAHEIRAKCMESLNDYLREGRQTVICCRREEFAAMQKTTKKDAPVSAKVEVLDLTKADIFLALHNAKKHNESRAAAENLEKLIETNETVLEVLSTPFYFTTALEVFDKPNFNDNNLPTDADKLKTYLLKNYVDNKIKYTAKLTDFEKDTNKIKHWLIWLARLMEKKHLANFELAHLQPSDLNTSRNYSWMGSILSGIIFLIISYSLSIYYWGAKESIVISLFIGSVGGFLFFITSSKIDIFPFNIFNKSLGEFYSQIFTEDFNQIEFSKFKDLSFLWKFFIYRVTVVILLAFGIGVLFYFVYSPITGGIFGLYFFLIFLLYALFTNLKNYSKFTKLHRSYERIMAFYFQNLVFAIILLSIAFGLNFLINFYIDNFEIFKFSIYSSNSYLIFLVIHHLFLIPAHRHFILRHCLWFEGSMPLKYATFLDLAAEARILEKDGGQWRFRHQNLQEYFAKLETGE